MNEAVWFLSIILIAGCVLLYAKYQKEEPVSNTLTQASNTPSSTLTANPTEEEAEVMVQDTVLPAPAPTNLDSLFCSEGMTTETRILAPKGYERVEVSDGGIGQYIRTMPLKPSGSKVMLYDGSAKRNQSLHVAVYDMDLGTRDLQQCADSIIRIYAEYLYHEKKGNQIAFHLTNGFLMEYSKWEKGYRIKVSGNEVSWVKNTNEDASYECFRKYLNSVFTYAGTLSLSNECEEITPEDIQIGDLLIEGGSPGHCVLVVDEAVNEKGEKCVLLAQGYMPAQEFHIIKNPLHEEDPWYYVSELEYPIKTAQWTFDEGTLRRFVAFPLQ